MPSEHLFSDDVLCFLEDETSQLSGLPNVMFKGDGFRKLTGPGVYIVWNNDRHCLYVGSARNVLSRISIVDHAALGPAAKDVYAVWVICCRGEAQARELEAFWIHKFKPLLNKVLPRPAYASLFKPFEYPDDG